MVEGFIIGFAIMGAARYTPRLIPYVLLLFRA